MIKRLIFDLDNTIINWKPEYINTLKELVKEYNIDIDYTLIDNIIENLEIKHKKISKEILLSDIKKELKLNLSIHFIEELLNRQKELSPENDIKIIDLFTYLSSKYEIVLLTNYFEDTQTGRLKKLGIYQFFKEIYAGDKIYLKPSKEAFKVACGNNKYEECMMIGDSEKFDIIPASKLGIKTIKVGKNSKYNSIENILELKGIL